MVSEYRSKAFFESEVNRVSLFIKRFQKDAKNKLKQFKKSIVTETFSSGGECLLRGYYNPSKIVDVVVRGVHRGRLLKRTSGNAKPKFRYGFNEESQLVFVESPDNQEVIWWEQDKEIGVSFDKSGKEIEYIIECFYENNRIKTFTTFTVGPFGTIDRCECEEYLYEKDAVSVNWYDWWRRDYFNFPPLMTHTRYVFSVKDGVLKRYTVYEYKDGKLREDVVNGLSFDALQDRTI